MRASSPDELTFVSAAAKVRDFWRCRVAGETVSVAPALILPVLLTTAIFLERRKSVIAKLLYDVGSLLSSLPAMQMHDLGRLPTVMVCATGGSLYGSTEEHQGN